MGDNFYNIKIYWSFDRVHMLASKWHKRKNIQNFLKTSLTQGGILYTDSPGLQIWL